MAMNIKFPASIGLLCALLAGCATGPHQPFVPAAPPPNAGAIYFYRPSEMTGRMLRPTITANGAKVGRLPNDSYGVFTVSPGTIALRSVWPGIPGTIRDDAATVNVEAGKNYYVRVRYHVTKAHNITPTIAGIGALSFENRAGLEVIEEMEAVPQLTGIPLSSSFGR